MYRIVYFDKATDEADDAVNWYQEQLSGLGERFVSEVQRCLDVIKKYPESYAPDKDGYRQIHLKKFPYMIIYQVLEAEKIIEIVSVFHTKRNPANKYK